MQHENIAASNKIMQHYMVQYLIKQLWVAQH